MKWILTVFSLAVFWVSSGCTFTISSEPPKKKTLAKYGSSKRHGKPSHPKKSQPVSTEVQSPNIKETWWIENYKNLQAAHGDYTIPADEQIKPLPDGRFYVPNKVLEHYQDMLLAKPTPNE